MTVQATMMKHSFSYEWFLVCPPRTHPNTRKRWKECMGRAGPKGCQPHSIHTPHFKGGDAVSAVARLKPQTEHVVPFGWQHWMGRSLASPPITGALAWPLFRAVWSHKPLSVELRLITYEWFLVCPPRTHPNTRKAVKGVHGTRWP